MESARSREEVREVARHRETAATIQNPMAAKREESALQFSRTVRPVAMRSFAAKYGTGMAMGLYHSLRHRVAREWKRHRTTK
ncbi:MAG TPA: hypothetical protein VNM68_05550 [Candidatus Polarisedimenticolia bacterium]|nr:hypothetical protein [Candidatus Polarisedimenticolia bacterium]